MNSQKDEIYSILDQHYPADISFLPSEDPYRFLITVILSASSTDKMAIYSASQLFAVYPNSQSVGQAEEKEIEALIHHSGLSKTKAHNIKYTSIYIAEHGIPDTMEGLTALPGVGEKTASCYLSTILHQPAVIADIHFVRVAHRLDLTDTDDRNKAAEEIRQRFDQEKWYRLSMTVNLHGRLVCRPKPKCDDCLLKGLCPSVIRR